MLLTRFFSVIPMPPTSHFYVYYLPPELLNTLTPRSPARLPEYPEDAPEELLSISEENYVATSLNGVRTCNICLGANFVTLNEQRTHFRSDWHRYNVKRRVLNQTAVAETTFAQLVDALDDSLSGSESSEEDSSDSDAVDNLIHKTEALVRPLSPEENSRSSPQTALVWFHSPPATQIGVYKALYTDPKDASSYLTELKTMQSGTEEGRTWAMFMVAGGHFAGAIVRVARPAEDEDEYEKDKKKSQKPKRETEILLHKTFHRYTTRRKQGGGQAANDNAKGPAKSAGALLRRYGEQSLRDDIRNLLAEWENAIHGCDRIWIRSSVPNRKIFMGYDNAIISKEDNRLRTFPFPTRRPTQSELARCLVELTRVKITHFTEESLREQDEAYLTSLPKPKPIPIAAMHDPEKPKAPVVKLSKEEQLLREKWARLLQMVSKGRLEPLKAFWEREAPMMGSIDTRIPEWAGEQGVSLLQVAAQAGHEDTTYWLLEEAHADPTIPVPNPNFEDLEEPKEGIPSDYSDTAPSTTKDLRRTAYDLAKTKAVRDVFRRCAAAHPDWWDWFGAARVPSALSKQMEEEQDGKKKSRRKFLKDRVKEREAREREKEKPSEVAEQTPIEPPPSRRIEGTSFSNRLGGVSGTTDGVVGLSPEMQAKVERERRARAAEARLKAKGL